MANRKTTVLGLIDFMPTHAKDKRLRPGLENAMKDKLIQEIPEMVSRLAKLEPLITFEVDVDFKREAMDAFQRGLWRAVIALVGVVTESFTESLYAKLPSLVLRNGTQMSKSELLGDRPSVQSKLATLRLLGIIESSHYRKLVQIWKLRGKYVHPPKKPRNAERDALTVMQLLRSVLKERFDKDYTIKQGKIVRKTT
jgi:hypothetical protein